MMRETIDYGIDLGTTNSAIAVLVGTAAEVITNDKGSTFIPSAIWYNKRGTLFVGQEADEGILMRLQKPSSVPHRKTSTIEPRKKVPPQRQRKNWYDF